ncbi:hypothetical protein V6Z11_D10G164800 [Gossypium hirsutum]
MNVTSRISDLAIGSGVRFRPDILLKANLNGFLGSRLRHRFQVGHPKLAEVLVEAME